MINISANPYPFICDENKTALMVIDMQKDFLEPGGFGESLGNDVSLLRSAIMPIQELLKIFRKNKLTIIHTREGHRRDLSDLHEEKLKRGNPKISIGQKGPMGRLLIRGEPGHDIIPEVYPLDGEPVIDKPGKGAFYGTDLELLLTNNNIKNLILCGVTTEVCVHSTLREANDRGYKCLIPSDGVASYFPEFQQSALKMVSAQAGIFGWVCESKDIKAAF